MKKLFCLLLAALLLCTLAACGHEDTAKKPAAEDAEGTAAVDIDLTALSGIMVYSEVNSMISFPDNYIGKTVKMKGQFTIYQATDESGAFRRGQTPAPVRSRRWHRYEEDGCRYYRLGNASFVD